MTYVYSDGDTTVAVNYDDFSESPRARGNLGTMITWGRDFNSPDENPYGEPQDFIEDLLVNSMINGTLDVKEIVTMIDNGDFPELRLSVRQPNDWELKYTSYTESDRIVEIEQLHHGISDTWYPEAKWPYFDTDNLLEGKLAKAEAAIYDIAEAVSAERQALKLFEGKIVLMPVYRFEHSNVAYSTSPFNDKWDSGQVGFIYADKETILNHYGVSLETAIQYAREDLKIEVADYSKWANGDVYVARTFEYEEAIHDWEETECVGGYYDIEEAVNESGLNFDSISTNVFDEPDSFSVADMGFFIEENFPEKYKELTYISPEEQLEDLKERRSNLDKEIASLESEISTLETSLDSEAKDMSAAKDAQDTPVAGHDKDKGVI